MSWGYFSWVIFVMGYLSGGYLSGGFCSGGFCPGGRGICPRTVFFVSFLFYFSDPHTSIKFK